MRFRLVENLEDINLKREKTNLIESIESKAFSIDVIDKAFGQEEPYMWSTYILPNGHFLNPDNYYTNPDKLDYEHSDFINFVKNTFGVSYWDAEDLFDEYCIKMNVTYPYLALPKNKPTIKQFQSIKDVVSNKESFIYSAAEIEDRVGDIGNAKEPLMILTPFDETAFDLSIYSADDIIKEINKAYMTKSFLNEDIEQLSNEYDSEGNQLTKAQAEFFKNSKVRDSKGRLLVCYHGTDKEFNVFDNIKSMRGILEGGLYFTTNKQVGNSYGRNGKVMLAYLDITGYLDLTNYSKNYKESILEFIPQDQIELGEQYEINSSNDFYFIDLANLVYKYQTYYKNACDVIYG